jgi:hypothetical protein
MLAAGGGRFDRDPVGRATGMALDVLAAGTPAAIYFLALLAFRKARAIWWRAAMKRGAGGADPPA